ncbi:MAG: YHS domain-containing protein [Vicinamibacteria bacterium]
MTLPTDPVCGMEIVDENAAPKSIFEGDPYSFCSEACKTKFDDQPERYATPNPAVPSSTTV